MKYVIYICKEELNANSTCIMVQKVKAFIEVQSDVFAVAGSCCGGPLVFGLTVLICIYSSIYYKVNFHSFK